MLVAQQTPGSINRGERIIAYTLAAMILLSLVAFFVIVIGTFTGMSSAEYWPVIILTPLIALPAAIILLVSLVIVSIRRRSRTAGPDTGPHQRKPRRK